MDKKLKPEYVQAIEKEFSTYVLVAHGKDGVIVCIPDEGACYTTLGMMAYAEHRLINGWTPKNDPRT